VQKESIVAIEGSVMDINKIIEAVQAKLGVDVDGRAGPETWGAIHKAIVGEGGVANELDGIVKTVDSRSEGIIAQLHPRVTVHILLAASSADGMATISNSMLPTVALRTAQVSAMTSKISRSPWRTQKSM
jgi:hypothetical protein